MQVRKSKEFIEKVKNLYNKKMSDNAIAKELHVCSATILATREDLNLPSNYIKHGAQKEKRSVSLCMNCANAYVPLCRKIAFKEKVYDESYIKIINGNNKGTKREVEIITKCKNYRNDERR